MPCNRPDLQMLSKGEDMTDSPEVTVVIPTHNDSDTLLRAIGSVVSQKYNNLEIIVVGDASDQDVSALIKEKFHEEGRILVYRHPKNKMLGSARNSGMNLATGDYIFFLDADDRLLPDAIVALISKAVETDADVVQGGTLIGRSDDDLSPFHAFDFISGGSIDGLEQLSKHRYASIASNKLYRTTFLNSFQEIRFTERYMREDVLFAAQTAFLAKRIVSISKPILHYTTNPNSLTYRSPTRLHIESCLTTYLILIQILHRFGVGQGKHPALFLRILRAHGTTEVGPTLLDCYAKMGPESFREELLSVAGQKFGDCGLAIGDLIAYFLMKIDSQITDDSLVSISQKVDAIISNLSPHAIAQEVWFERQRWGLPYKISKWLRSHRRVAAGSLESQMTE
jgi:cellulose synthase/poly-beta-1,6-N-acetylglucosamine synthase-like glycosyltransferase